ncbi:hypothetical protein HH310_30090 [Actinoplanes sp. TBRC 11911]|uniref:WXG100-like domain-containing protein n=1 Tax=Actinoplanes sp. TBRC 11911 TaxID=2729386 RepID=UPI00145CB773|nr:hypothetical protein [Actinoplanes sp. TBRC 11911]NMO55421.1 hypothetical protein [Actinoplanes sp. TBRC 11911]
MIEVSNGVAEFLKWLTGEELPGTDPDLLRVIAAAHGDAADGVDEVIPMLVAGINRIREGVMGESERAFVDTMKDYVSDDGFLAVASKYVRRMGNGLDDTANQVEYTQIMVVLTVIELMVELAVALAIAWFYPGIMSEIAARLVIGRFVIAEWLAQLIVAVVASQVVGIGLQVLMDVIAQLSIMSDTHGWNVNFTREAAGVGAWTGMVGLFLGGAGGVVGGSLAKVFTGAASRSGEAVVDKLVTTAGGGAGHAGGGHSVARTLGHGVGHVGEEGVHETAGETSYNGMKHQQITGIGVAMTAVSGGVSGLATFTGTSIGTSLNHLTQPHDSPTNKHDEHSSTDQHSPTKTDHTAPPPYEKPPPYANATPLTAVPNGPPPPYESSNEPVMLVAPNTGAISDGPGQADAIVIESPVLTGEPPGGGPASLAHPVPESSPTGNRPNSGPVGTSATGDVVTDATAAPARASGPVGSDVRRTDTFPVFTTTNPDGNSNPVTNGGPATSAGLVGTAPTTETGPGANTAPSTNAPLVANEGTTTNTDAPAHDAPRATAGTPAPGGPDPKGPSKVSAEAVPATSSTSTVDAPPAARKVWSQPEDASAAGPTRTENPVNPTATASSAPAAAPPISNQPESPGSPATTESPSVGSTQDMPVTTTSDPEGTVYPAAVEAAVNIHVSPRAVSALRQATMRVFRDGSAEVSMDRLERWVTDVEVSSDDDAIINAVDCLPRALGAFTALYGRLGNGRVTLDDSVTLTPTVADLETALGSEFSSARGVAPGTVFEFVTRNPGAMVLLHTRRPNGTSHVYGLVGDGRTGEVKPRWVDSQQSGTFRDQATPGDARAADLSAVGTQLLAFDSGGRPIALPDLGGVTPSVPASTAQGSGGGTAEALVDPSLDAGTPRGLEDRARYPMQRPALNPISEALPVPGPSNGARRSELAAQLSDSRVFDRLAPVAGRAPQALIGVAAETVEAVRGTVTGNGAMAPADCVALATAFGERLYGRRPGFAHTDTAVWSTGRVMPNLTEARNQLLTDGFWTSTDYAAMESAAATLRRGGSAFVVAIRPGRRQAHALVLHHTSEGPRWVDLQAPDGSRVLGLGEQPAALSQATGLYAALIDSAGTPRPWPGVLTRPSTARALTDGQPNPGVGSRQTPRWQALAVTEDGADSSAPGNAPASTQPSPQTRPLGPRPTGTGRPRHIEPDQARPFASNRSGPRLMGPRPRADQLGPSRPSQGPSQPSRALPGSTQTAQERSTQEPLQSSLPMRLAVPADGWCFINSAIIVAPRQLARLVFNTNPRVAAWLGKIATLTDIGRADIAVRDFFPQRDDPSARPELGQAVIAIADRIADLMIRHEDFGVVAIYAYRGFADVEGQPTRAERLAVADKVRNWGATWGSEIGDYYPILLADAVGMRLFIGTPSAPQGYYSPDPQAQVVNDPNAGTLRVWLEKQHYDAWPLVSRTQPPPPIERAPPEDRIPSTALRLLFRSSEDSPITMESFREVLGLNSATPTGQVLDSIAAVVAATNESLGKNHAGAQVLENPERSMWWLDPPISRPTNPRMEQNRLASQDQKAGATAGSDPNADGIPALRPRPARRAERTAGQPRSGQDGEKSGGGRPESQPFLESQSQPARGAPGVSRRRPRGMDAVDDYDRKQAAVFGLLIESSRDNPVSTTRFRKALGLTDSIAIGEVEKELRAVAAGINRKRIKDGDAEIRIHKIQGETASWWLAPTDSAAPSRGAGVVGPRPRDVEPPRFDTWVGAAVSQLPKWDGRTADCVLRVDRVLAALQVGSRPVDDDVVNVIRIQERLGAQLFQPTSAGAFSQLPAGALTVVWTEHPSDNQHLMLVHRPSSPNRPLVLVETQASGNERYTVLRSTTLSGSLRVPVDDDGHLLYVRLNTDAEADSVRGRPRVQAARVAVPDGSLTSAFTDPSRSARPGLRSGAGGPALESVMNPRPSLRNGASQPAVRDPAERSYMAVERRPNLNLGSTQSLRSEQSRVKMSTLTQRFGRRMTTDTDSDTWVATALDRLQNWDGESADCVVRVGSVLTGLGVPPLRSVGDGDVATASEIALRLGGKFVPASSEALTLLPRRAVTVLWTKRPNDPQHMVLVRRPSSDDRLVLVETQAAGDERYIAVDPAALPSALGGALWVPVNDQGYLLWVQQDVGLRSSSPAVADTSLAAAITDPPRRARPGMQPSGGGYGHSTSQWHAHNQGQNLAQTQYQHHYPASLIGVPGTRSQHAARAAYAMINGLRWRGGSGADATNGWTGSIATTGGYHNDFQSWIQDRADLIAEPSISDGVMNCWEALFFAAYRAGLVTKQQLQNIYAHATWTASSAANAKQHQIGDVRSYSDAAQIAQAGDDAYFSSLERALYRGDLSSYDFSTASTGIGQTTIPVGNVVIFDRFRDHVALSLGMRDAQGRQLVMSHWNRPLYSYDPLDLNPNANEPPSEVGWMQLTTVEELKHYGGFNVVRFGRLAWA